MIATSTLYETLGAYDGLAFQAFFRATLFGAPLVLFAAGLIFIFVRDRSLKAPDEMAWNMAKYGFVTAILLLAFYPEGAFVGRPLTTNVTADAVVSVNAQANAETIQNAAQYKTNLGQTAIVPPVPPTFLMLVEMVSGATMSIGQFLSANANRPSSRAFPMSWLLTHKLDSDTLNDLRHWATKCVKRARVTLLNKNPDVTYQEGREIPGTALYAEMATHRVFRRKGILNAFVTRTTCNVLGDELRASVTASLTRERTPGGETLATVIQSELGMSLEDAVSFTIMNLVRRTLGPEIPVSSLGVELTTVGALRMIVSGLGNFIGNLSLTQPGRPVGGFTKAAGDEINAALGKLQQHVGAALIFANWAPYIYAKVIFVVIGLFPMVMWFVVAAPGRQLAPLAIYLGWLFVAFSSPIVFGVIEFFTETFTNTNVSVMDEPGAWAHNQIGILAIQSSGYVVAAIVALFVTLAGTLGIARFVKV